MRSRDGRSDGRSTSSRISKGADPAQRCLTSDSNSSQSTTAQGRFEAPPLRGWKARTANVLIPSKAYGEVICHRSFDVFHRTSARSGREQSYTPRASFCPYSRQTILRNSYAASLRTHLTRSLQYKVKYCVSDPVPACLRRSSSTYPTNCTGHFEYESSTAFIRSLKFSEYFQRQHLA